MKIAKINIHISKIADFFKKISQRYYFFGILFVVAISIVALLWPKTVVLSYESAKTCFFQPTIAPELLRSTSDDGFRLEADQAIRIGNTAIAAANMCIVPVEAPKVGLISAQLSVLGSPLRKTYIIEVPESPKAIQSLPKTPIPLSIPLIVKLGQTDLLHEYKVLADGKSADCTMEAAQLACDMKPMKLSQGKDYTLAIERYFADKQAGTLVKQTIRTLEATSVIDTSIKQGEVVYARPSGVEISVDKDVTDATLRLYRIDGEKRVEIKTQVTHSDKKINAKWPDELTRQASYELEIASVTAKDGSGLDGAYRLGFAMSGGPKVTNVSVGTYKVPIGTTVMLTFDQPILETQNVAQAITATGGAQVVGKKGNQAMISFKNVPRCGDVTIKVADSLKSNHDISGGSVWNYTTRTQCQQIGSIGSSVKGRSITTYSFGNGQRTVVFTGAIHGSEGSTRALMLRWIDELELNARNIPGDKTVVVIPVINPDGIAAGSRTNANNVDLNRNFATGDWVSDITTTSNTPFPGGGGKTALSEPESRAIANFIGSTRPLLVLSYHSIGALLAANQAGDSGARAATYASLSGYRNTTGSSGTFEYGISGTADDYYAEAYGVPSVLIELGSHTDAQFSRNQKAMWAMLR